MRNLALRLLINAAALWVAGHYVDGVALTGGVADTLVVALIFGLVNALIKPIVKFFSFPVIFLTLGLFTFVINGAMLWLTSTLTGSLHVSGPVPAVVGSVVISLVSVVLSWLLKDDDDED